MPDPKYVEEALAQHAVARPHRHRALEPDAGRSGETVVLLPATTRYEIPGGVTQTSTERRIMFSPEDRGAAHRRSAAGVGGLLELAGRVRPDAGRPARLHRHAGDPRGDRRGSCRPTTGIQQLRKTGDQVQYGGPHLAAGWNFPTADGRGSFSAVDAAAMPRFRRACSRWPPGAASSSTRWSTRQSDAITGAAARDAVFMHAGRRRRRSVCADGDPVVLRNEFGEMRGRVYLAPDSAAQSAGLLAGRQCADRSLPALAALPRAGLQRLGDDRAGDGRSRGGLTWTGGRRAERESASRRWPGTAPGSAPTGWPPRSRSRSG